MKYANIWGYSTRHTGIDINITMEAIWKQLLPDVLYTEHRATNREHWRGLIQKIKKECGAGYSNETDTFSRTKSLTMWIYIIYSNYALVIMSIVITWYYDKKRLQRSPAGRHNAKPGPVIIGLQHVYTLQVTVASSCSQITKWIGYPDEQISDIFQPSWVTS